MTDVVVDARRRRLHFRSPVVDLATDCAIGRSEAVLDSIKIEGDGATPLGCWPIRGALLRRDRVPRLDLDLAWRWLRPDDGWSDDAADPAYNRPVRHPWRFSAERLWRDDHLYDVIIVLGHNDAPPVPSRGSAIFLHLWHEGQPTEGCVAIPRQAMLTLLPALRRGDAVRID